MKDDEAILSVSNKLQADRIDRILLGKQLKNMERCMAIKSKSKFVEVQCLISNSLSYHKKQGVVISVCPDTGASVSVVSLKAAKRGGIKFRDSRAKLVNASG